MYEGARESELLQELLGSADLLFLPLPQVKSVSVINYVVACLVFLLFSCQPWKATGMRLPSGALRKSASWLTASVFTLTQGVGLDESRDLNQKSKELL